MSQLVSIRMSGVTEVLLGDGWHAVKPRTFDVGELAFAHDDQKIEGPGPGQRLWAVQWTEPDTGQHVTCPLSAVRAVKGAP